MPLTSGQTTVGTVAVQIDGADENPSFIHLHNNDNTKTLYLGGEGVTTSTGLALLKEDSIDLVLYPGNQLYGVTSSGTHTVSWLRQTI